MDSSFVILLLLKVWICRATLFSIQDTTIWPFDNNEKVENSNEFFDRLDTDNNSLIDFNDYLRRNSFFTETSRREFQKIDQNHDGNLTKEELHEYNKMLKMEQKADQLSASNITFSASFRRLFPISPTFQVFDQNSDQKLSLDELRAYIRDYLHRQTDNTNKVLVHFDANNDTKLDLEEFSRLDFAFPFEEFPVSFNIPPTLIDQATTINSRSYFQTVHTSKNKNNTQP